MMEQDKISDRSLLTIIAATLAGMAVGGVLLGPPGAAAMSVICGCGTYGQCRDLDDQP